MPLEDVQFMQEKSVIDSKMIFIDSSKRRKEYYPFPHHYTVDFNEPFTNVCGIEILDAMIVSTMYNMENFNNSFKYHQVFITNPIDVSTDDSKIQYNFEELQYYSEFVKRFEAEETSRIVLCNNMSVLQTLTNLSINTSSIFDRVMVIIRKELQLEKINIVSETYVVKDGEYVFFNHGKRYVVNDWIPDENIQVQIRNENASVRDNSIVYFEHVYISIGNLQIVYDDLINTGSVTHIIHNGFVKVDPGNYDIITLQTKLNNILNATNDEAPWSYVKPFFNQYKVGIIPADDASNVTLHMRYDFVIEEGNSNRLLLNPGKSTMVNVLGINIPYPSGDYPSNCFKDIMFNSDLLMMSITNSNGRTIVGTPGIINLNSGVKYMLLRCPEIESHLHNSFASSGFCPGIGLFKHTGNNDQNNYRFDYTNFQKRPFHPIGKLSKLTFSFELSTGVSYDFKGVDHTLLLSIKYYTPKDNRSIKDIFHLNPNYNPDYLSYMVDRNTALNDVKNILDDGDDDGEDDDGENYNYENYAKDKTNQNLQKTDMNEQLIRDFILENNKYEYDIDD